ncbi:MAG: hypothetical protein KIG25_06020 [Eubacteriales bacterium]|nr:hypothetical protein [Eubacteriales bacterium]
MKTGFERLQSADRMLRLFLESFGVLPPKPASTRKEPVGEPAAADKRKIFAVFPSMLFEFTSNMPSSFIAWTHTVNGNRAGKTFVIKSSKPLAAPIIDCELKHRSIMHNIITITVKTCLMTKTMSWGRYL